ncbi:MAG: hypothetical protein FRX49_02941 [Trebouxia sp. A1-2]|nr:MAG: hypothetical protein FRX49_02941 [Trebouxia sp. A1-2]
MVKSSSCDNRQPPCTRGVLTPEDPCLQPKSDFTPSQQHSDKVIIGRAYCAAGAVCGIALGLRKLWN